MYITVKSTYSILGYVYANPLEKVWKFSVPLKDKGQVKIEVFPKYKYAECYYDIEISSALWNALEASQTEIEKLSDIIQREVLTIHSDIYFAVTKLVGILKYYLNWEGIDELLLAAKSFLWTVENKEWKMMPWGLHAKVGIFNYEHMTDETAPNIQHYLDTNEFQPFFALRHLHRAKNEQNPRYKWIDATIAAELAVKEFLIRIKPEIESLLLEMPSPPLHKMYDVILTSFGYQRSPRLKAIREGVEIRNKLVHRPNETPITEDQADKYVEEIEQAIFHLLSMLYPDDQVIRRLAGS